MYLYVFNCFHNITKLPVYFSDMGRMNIAAIRYMEQEHFRVLIAVEMGMKNHELVPLELIASIARTHRGAVVRILTDLSKHGTVAHERGKRYDGYRLTTLGYDILALKALNSREVVGAVGNQIGVGKESDVFVGGDLKLNDLVLKFHRLGRTSFRKLKEKRDYLKKRKSCSWLYLSSLAAAKEFAFLKALHDHNFPLPRPIDRCRHVVVMDLIDGSTLCHVQHVNDAEELYEKLMTIIVRLARYGLIHGDFNEFNIMLTQEEEPILIDLPQMVSMDHPNAQFYFERDVNCVRTFFRKRFNYESELYPKFEAMTRKYNLDVEVNASGFTPRMSKAFDKAVEKALKDVDSSTSMDEDDTSEEAREDVDSSTSMDEDDTSEEAREDVDSSTTMDEDDTSEESSDSQSDIDESNENTVNNGYNNRLKEWIKNAQDELEKLKVEDCSLLDNCSYSTDEKHRRIIATDSIECSSKPENNLLHEEDQIAPAFKNEETTKSVFSMGSTIAPEVVRKRVAAEMKAKQKIPSRVKGKANALVRLKKTNAKIIKDCSGWDF
uniref:Serine/threonine-protein kinase RIO2 n=1 Tax=Onchocerca volvulus TaxID=6282 RepID=A0A2K6VK90_ONCVO